MRAHFKHIGIIVSLILAFALGTLTGYFAPFFLVKEVRIDEVPERSTQDVRSESDAPSVPTSGATIDTTQLSEGQRQLLGTLGIDDDEFTVTQEMVLCAEGAVGSARFAEIKDGATPSIIEGVKLLSCYRASGDVQTTDGAGGDTGP